jgi:hypothetical protein
MTERPTRHAAACAVTPLAPKPTVSGPEPATDAPTPAPAETPADDHLHAFGRDICSWCGMRRAWAGADAPCGMTYKRIIAEAKRRARARARANA